MVLFLFGKEKNTLMIKRSLLLSLLFIFFNCNPSGFNEGEEYITEEILIRVNSYTETCQGLAEMQCLLIQKGEQIGTEEWEYFYDSIKGFEYEEGYRYDLDVKITQVVNPPADASSLRYELIRLIRKFRP